MRNLYLLLLITFLLLSSCSHLSKTVQPEHTSAYIALYNNQTDKARNLLNSTKDDSMKLFLFSSLELSEGNIEASKNYAIKLTNEYEDCPEGKILLNLIERREENPNESWINAYTLAYKEAGSPELDFPLNIVFATNWVKAKIECDNKLEIPGTIRNTPKGLLLAYEKKMFSCNANEYFELLLNTYSEMPYEIKLFIYNEFYTWHYNKSNITDEVKKRSESKKIELIKELSNEEPSYMYFAITDILEQAPNDGPLLENEIAMLEKAVSRNHFFKPSRYDLFNYYLTLFKELNVDNPYSSAAEVTNSAYPVFPVNLLSKITESTKDADEQTKERFAKILEKTSKAILKGRTLMDYTIGSLLLRRASNLRDDKELEAIANEMFRFSHKLTFLSSSTSLYWPITPLLNESISLSMKDEIGFMLTFTGEKIPENISHLINDDYSVK